jgi:hypothetical protein
MKVYEINGIRKVFPDSATDEDVVEYFKNATALTAMRKPLRMHKNRKPSKTIKSWKQ